MRVVKRMARGGDSKAPQWEKQMAMRLVEDRQTLLDTSLVLSTVFLEFTDKKYAGGRHHQSVCVSCMGVCMLAGYCV